MPKTYRLGPVRRLINAVTRALIATPLGPRAYVMLTVTGRRTGRRYSTPVRLMEHDGERFLVAPYGAVGWVHNARAAGSVTLSRYGRRHETVAVAECDVDESAPVLRAYVELEPITRSFFDAQPGDPVERFAAEAARHPVFRVVQILVN